MDDSTRTIHGDPLPPSESGSASAAGTRLDSWGPFELREKVGQGGFGEVYRAWDPKLQREVALKLLVASRAVAPGAYESILREARIMAKVRHANVVAVHGVSRHGGRVGFWSDFVRGRTLSSVLAAQGPFAAREAANIGIELCGAVSAVHAAGLLHRDIKPGNVMREEGGRILLMDFGLTQVAEKGGFGGTPPYMAPELFAGESASVASDVYALGALLFELVTGKHPVEPDGGAMNLRDVYSRGIRRSLIEERPDLPVQFARVVETAIDPDPKKRFASAAQFLVALSNAMGMSSVSLPMMQRRPAPSRWWMAAAVPVLLLAGYAVPSVRNGIQTRLDRATGAHADYVKAQDLLEHYYQPHNLENSIPLFQKNIEKEPKFAPAWAGLGRAYWRRYVDTRDPNYKPLAKDACAKALEVGQNLASVHVTLGMIATDEGKNDLATQELEQAQNLDATNADVYGAFSDLYRKVGRANEIEPALQKAMDLDPKDWRWPNQLGLYHMYYSTTANLDAAARAFRQSIALTPDNGRAYNNLGLAFRNQERFDEARTAFEKAIELEAASNYLSNLGAVLQLEGEYAKAADIFRRALESNPSNYVAAGNLASALVWTPGREADARVAYRNAIELAERYRKDRPNDAKVIADLGSFYACIGESAKSLPLLRQALALDPKGQRILYRVSEGYELLHRRDDALRYLAQAIEAGYPMEYIKRDPEFAALRADPRFSSLGAKR
jgi:serine/threonine protein kinase/Flp pilus assembly protein TadD